MIRKILSIIGFIIFLIPPFHLQADENAVDGIDQQAKEAFKKVTKDLDDDKREEESLHKVIAKAEKEKNELNGEIHEANDEIQKLKQEQEELNKRRDHAELDVGKLQSQVAALKAQYQQITAENKGPK